MPTISAFLSQANGTYSTLNSQLEAAINEVSMAHNLIIMLRLKISPWWVHEAKCLSTTKVTFSHIGFRNMTCLAILTWKFLYLQNLGKMHFFGTTELWCPLSDNTNVTHTCSPQALYKDTFLLADYQSSTATPSYNPLWQFGEVHTYSYCIAILQHIPCIHSASYGNSTSLEYQLMSFKDLVWCS